MGPGTEAKEFSSQQFANFIFGFLSSPRIGRPVFVVSRDQRKEKRNKLCKVQLPLSAIVFRAKVEIDLWFLLWFNLDRFFNHHFGMGWHDGEWVSEWGEKAGLMKNDLGLWRCKWSGNISARFGAPSTLPHITRYKRRIMGENVWLIARLSLASWSWRRKIRFSISMRMCMSG